MGRSMPGHVARARVPARLIPLIQFSRESGVIHSPWIRTIVSAVELEDVLM